MRTETATPVTTTSRGDLAFGPFTFDRSSRLLWKDGVELAVPPRVLGVLEFLLDRPGQVVSKHDLISSVWPDAFVTETSLAEAISVLRQTLGDDPQRPTYIQTLHRRGYRFIAGVRPATPGVGVPRATSAPSVAIEEPAARLSLVIPWTVALFALIVAAAAVWKFTNAPPAPPRAPVRFTISLPSELTLPAEAPALAVSRDGALIAFSACRDVECAIHLRPLAQAGATRIAGTTGGMAPFFSPDARWLGFFAHGTLQKIALAGGSAIALANAEPSGATWTADGRIVFAGSPGGGLSIVGETGGPVSPLTQPKAGEGGHRWPDLVPDGSAVVFTVDGTGGDAGHSYAAVVSLRTKGWGRLLDGVLAARVPLAGYLLAQRGSDLTAVPFDNRSLSVLALPTPVAPGVLAEPAAFDSAQAGNRLRQGRVASRPDEPVLVWRSATADRPGGPPKLYAKAEAGPYTNRKAPQFALSPSGTLVYAASGISALNVVLEWHEELRRLVPPPQPPLPR
jgi:DNA-binding winged helix-turn-helix (wHTH) protein